MNNYRKASRDIHRIMRDLQNVLSDTEDLVRDLGLVDADAQDILSDAPADIASLLASRFEAASNLIAKRGHKIEEEAH